MDDATQDALSLDLCMHAWTSVCVRPIDIINPLRRLTQTLGSMDGGDEDPAALGALPPAGTRIPPHVLSDESIHVMCQQRG